MRNIFSDWLHFCKLIIELCCL